MQNKKYDLFSNLQTKGVVVDDHQKIKIINRMNEMLSYQPKVGVLGKTGAGKSSLCNALFGMDVAPISDVRSCTRDIQNVFVDIGGNKSIILVDVPGVGENKAYDVEYERLYKTLLPELDILLWVIKADDRALSIDEEFFSTIVKPYLSQDRPVIIVLNQVDKIEPFSEWDYEYNLPSTKQLENILHKVSDTSVFFNLQPSKIIPVSAYKSYNLVQLVDEIIFSLPNDKKINLLNEVREENISQRSKDNALKSFLESIEIWCQMHIPNYFKLKAFVRKVIEIIQIKV